MEDLNNDCKVEGNYEKSSLKKENDYQSDPTESNNFIDAPNSDGVDDSIETEEDKGENRDDQSAPKEGFPCQHCPKVCKNKAAFAVHIKIHDPTEFSPEGGNIGKQCDLCKRVFYHNGKATATRQLLSHVRTCKGGAHRNRPRTCHKCGKSFSRPYFCKRHAARCSPSCQQCGKKFKTHKGFGLHLCPKSKFLQSITGASSIKSEPVHNENIELPSVDIFIKEEPEPEEETDSQTNVDPIKIEPNDDYNGVPFAIEYSEEDFEQKLPVDDQQEDGIPCQYCPKVCKNKSAFTNHSRVHQSADLPDGCGNVGKECDLCKKIFYHNGRATAVSQLLSHKRSCKGGRINKPKTCLKCGKSFFKPYLCSRHSLKCSPVCPLCGQQFKTHTGLQRHVCKPSHNIPSPILPESLEIDGHFFENKQ